MIYWKSSNLVGFQFGVSARPDRLEVFWKAKNLKAKSVQVLNSVVQFIRFETSNPNDPYGSERA